MSDGRLDGVRPRLADFEFQQVITVELSSAKGASAHPFP